MKDWYVGQRVVCVANFNHLSRQYNLIVPEKGSIYTIREVFIREDTVCLTLTEIRNRIDLMSSGVIGEIAFEQKGFRPLDESRLNQFHVHLNPKRVEEKIDA